ncbi:hypothetical protein CathTA2_0737 [Caldalkalibacillus thermarum TA2.A1]|uniref:Uncharacterized protein n=1 Tax=Caldalkalibacillus thermarum (strain TA2.A1) TaxID=986075 RepID=F5L4M4_CALTT|nr:hypothetical protein [Caldalkalibacillus thermarum]EGL83718.1 hypothetical protein CathTA2_0737 [Caldalkalibacillus thermarum TA2.A1]QZT33887.1 hypothetical protein HUR95_17080 [Caldalkalibacillus thermarum TA2.A1]GGK27411.1 hypothetical protein GCM10010965_20310 [Caldalkalibacillus thermarum]
MRHLKIKRLVIGLLSLVCLGMASPTGVVLKGQLAAAQQGLPPSKTVTIEIEGIKEEMTLYLHEAKQLGFYTYLPQDMAAENKWKAMLAYFKPGGHKMYKAKLEILTRDEIESVEEMAEFIQGQLAEKGFTVEPSQARRFGFSAQEFRLSKDNLTGKVSIFEYNQRVFALIYHYPPEYGDGFETRMEIILDELVWYESGYK